MVPPAGTSSLVIVFIGSPPKGAGGGAGVAKGVIGASEAGELLAGVDWETSELGGSFCACCGFS